MAETRAARRQGRHEARTRNDGVFGGRGLLYVYAGLVYLFLFLPIIIVVIASLTTDGRTSFPPSGFTFDWYQELAKDDDLIDAFQTSLLIAVMAAAIASTLGLLAAYGLSRYAFRLKRGAQALFYLPMLVPGVVSGISLVIWFNRIDLDTGFVTILIAHAVHALPYTLTLILTSFYGFDRRLEEAAQDLGANEWRTFRRVTLPLVLPGVIGGALIAFTLSFDEFVLTFFVAGGGVNTLPLEIYSRIRFLLSPVINSAAAVVILVSITLILGGQVLAAMRRGERAAA
ncbi:MAG: ABC transporter permease [Thermomicrobiales bacterium]